MPAILGRPRNGCIAIGRSVDVFRRCGPSDYGTPRVPQDCRAGLPCLCYQFVITYWVAVLDRDPGLNTLLDLHGETLFVDDSGHWVKFVVVRTKVTPERPHGLNYSLTLHAPNGSRLVGFDNAHPVRTRRGPSGGQRAQHDHRHRLSTTRTYEYEDAGTLLADFWKEVDQVLREGGSIP